MVASVMVPDCVWQMCNCRRIIRRGGASAWSIVKARLWDCPSCGYDKRKTLRSMIASELTRWLLTFTYQQPAAYDKLGAPLTPPEHEHCDRYSHVYLATHADTGRPVGWRWRTLTSCARCCARRGRMLDAMVKRLKRLWGNGFKLLWVMEVHKNGAMHIHAALTGVPEQINRVQRKHVADAWLALGGGYVNFRPPPEGSSASALGWYLGKYLAKPQALKMAPGYRRWGRSRSFAADIRMRWVDPEAVAPVDLVAVVRAEFPGLEVLDLAEAGPRSSVVGWRHPFLPGVWKVRAVFSPQTVAT